jgi:hypothetical protein
MPKASKPAPKALTSLRIPAWWPAAAKAAGTSMAALLHGLTLSGDEAAVVLPGSLDQDQATFPQGLATPSQATACGHLSVADLIRASLAKQYPAICTREPSPGVVRLVLVDSESKAVRVVWVPLEAASAGPKAVKVYLRKERQIDVHGYKVTEAEAPIPGRHFEGIRLSARAWAERGAGK